MTRVVVVTNSYTYMVRFRRELLLDIQSLGHRVTLACPASDSYALGAVDLPVERIDLPLTQHGVNIFSELRALFVLYKMLRELKPDLVLNFTIKPALYGSISAAWAKVPRIVSVFTGLGYWFTRSDGDSSLIGIIIKAGLRLALNRNELVFFQNTDDQRLLVEEKLVALSKTRIVDGSGVDISHFAPRASLPAPNTFLLVGRLLREKGIREYVAAARKLKSTYPSAAFSLLGPIDTSPSAISSKELQEWIAEGVITYLGEVADVRPLVQGAGVIVLPSYREGTPRSVLEAMAMGKPIVASDAPGCRETVRNGVNGFLVPVGDVEALSAAMARFIENPQLEKKMGTESRRLAMERYDVRKVNAAFLQAVGLAGQ